MEIWHSILRNLLSSLARKSGIFFWRDMERNFGKFFIWSFLGTKNFKLRNMKKWNQFWYILKIYNFSLSGDRKKWTKYVCQKIFNFFSVIVHRILHFFGGNSCFLGVVKILWRKNMKTEPKLWILFLF